MTQHLRLAASPNRGQWSTRMRMTLRRTEWLWCVVPLFHSSLLNRSKDENDGVDRAPELALLSLLY